MGESTRSMAKFQYLITVLLETEARNSDEAYNKFQEMKIKDAVWDNIQDGVELISGEEIYDD
jgi:hypothetical protein